MLRQRVQVVIFLLPLGLTAMYFGGLWFLGLMLLVLTLAAKEYVQLFRAGGYKPAGILVVGGTFIFTLVRGLYGIESGPTLISFFILMSMAYHLWAYEHGRDQALMSTDVIKLALILLLRLLERSILVGWVHICCLYVRFPMGFGGFG